MFYYLAMTVLQLTDVSAVIMHTWAFLGCEKTNLQLIFKCNTVFVNTEFKQLVQGI